MTKGYTPNWSKEVFVIQEVKNTVPWTHAVNDFNGKEIIGTFYEKPLRKTNQKEFRIEKVIKRKETNYISNGKDMITQLIAELIKKTHLNHLVEILMLKLIYLILQQKQISKIFHMLILQVSH